MKSCVALSLRRACAGAVGFVVSIVASGQTPGTALIRHAPTLNGTIAGSVQQMSAEAMTLNGNAAVTGTLLVPGTPSVRLNGHPAFGGTSVGAGTTTPSNYSITLNGNAQLGQLRTCTDAVALPSVAAPASPVGTRSCSRLAVTWSILMNRCRMPCSL